MSSSQYRSKKGKFYADFESAGKVAKVLPQRNLYG
jgi:hypothetical protein